ncbi:hypothetical protein [Nesterenkonia muleiensis]|uniref:hypothetical protein n=1 Tax=Nesterenkonia muleiensis TaxID=2282648 RepID=UPI000E7626F2|nr:hypothetical protein [Nesterenkonia muleiensis]
MSEDPAHREQPHGAPLPPEGYRPPHAGSSGSSEREEEPLDTPKTVTMQVPGFLSAVRIRHAVTVLISQGIAYMTLLLLAVLGCILLVLGLTMDSETAEVEVMAGDLGNLIGTPDFTDVLSSFVIPFQVVGLWLFGTLRFEVGMPDFFQEMFAQFGGAGASAEMTFTFWMPNLLVLAVALWVAVWAGRRLAGRGEVPLSQLPVLAKLVINVLVSAALAGLTLLITWALAFRQSLDMAQALGEDIPEAELEEMAEFMGIQPGDMDITFFSSAAGLSLFWGALAFYLLIGLLVSAKKGIFGTALTRLNSVLPSITRTPRVMVVHSMIIVIPALVYVCIRFLADGSPGTVMTSPLWGSSAAVIAFILLTSGAVHGSGEFRDMIGFGQSESGSTAFYLWSGGADELPAEVSAEDEWIYHVLADGFAWWEVLISVLIGLFALFAASLTWSMVRQASRGAVANILSFLTLPLVYAVLGATLTLFGQMRVEISMMNLMTGQIALGPAWWSFLILLIIGAIIEALARVCSAFISDSVPAPIRRILAGKRRSTPASAAHQDPFAGPLPPPYSGPTAPNAGNSPPMP